jgi:hypothetical protein
MTLKRIAHVTSVLALFGCTEQKKPPERTERLEVAVRLPSGDPLPALGEPPLPLPAGNVELDFDVRALKADGSLDAGFNGFVRMSAVPGAVVSVTGTAASGRNVLLLNGEAQNQRITIDNARGATRLWAEDIGYVPELPDKPPACADGIDNDTDGDLDFPKDPGCAFANDDTEGGGSYAAGVSPPVRYERPRLGDVQGRGATSPYDLESVEVETESPAELIVTRIAADGFYASDITETDGYGHIFAFTFSAPPFLRVCDRITKLSGTSVEFFGFTELSFPSFERHAWRFPDQTGENDGPCRTPEPVLLDPASVEDPSLLERIESALVRIENVSVGAFFGPEPVQGAQFGSTSSNCDLDGSGFIDFDTPNSNEAACANACGAEPECVEWTGYISRGNYRVVLPGGTSIQVNTRAIAGFDPPSMRGKTIQFVSGTLRNFSGGDLNWTIEARCSDDLVCDEPSQLACAEGPSDKVSSQTACVEQRTTDDPNEATN